MKTILTEKQSNYRSCKAKMASSFCYMYNFNMGNPAVCLCINESNPVWPGRKTKQTTESGKGQKVKDLKYTIGL